MEKLKSSMSAKIAAMLLMMVCLVLFIGSAAGMVLMDSIGGYQKKKSEMLQKAYEQACANYSVIAMSGYEEDFKQEELSDTNFQYGVVKAEKISDVDFKDPKSYIGGNFDEIAKNQGIPEIGELYVQEFDISENSYFNIGSGSILDSYYMNHGPVESYTERTFPLDGYVYNTPSNDFYVRSGKKLFPLSGIIRYGETEELTEEGTGFLTEDETGYHFIENAQAEFDHGEQVSLSEIKILKDNELEAYTVVPDALEYMEEDKIHALERHEVKTEHYIVASYVRQPLLGASDFRDGDMFIQAELLVDFAYTMRYPVIFILVLSLVLLISSFVFLMSAAGHRKGQEGISISFLDKLPLDMYFCLLAVAEWLIACMVLICGSTVFGWSAASMTGLVSFIVVTACAGMAGVLLFIAFCMSFAVHVKLGKWWRYTVIYWLWKKCLHVLAKVLRFCVYMIVSLFRSITLLWKAWLVLGFLAFAEFAVLMSGYVDSRVVMFWMMEKIIVYPLLMIQLVQLDKLQKGAQRIANGALDYQIDTRHMFWEIKKHGEYLNDIGNGINCAVNERMKSEHFKTELITNVSHDIKTPLTSIINYVDLLQKEEIKNPTVQEYLEVLHRQSARLKKLIEDLMEASKASTGSLNVVMEKCEAGVMLVQTVGEFEEKLMENQIELQIKKPEADIFIQADNRHLWRVFDNLMNNICKYAQPMTRAYVNLEQQGEQAVITFRNISKYQLNISSEELMERFVRGDSSRNTEGSGLGISIAKSLTELMNGYFELIVDGDLFKVVLTFPLYDAGQPVYLPREERLRLQQDVPKRETHLLEGIAIGIQSAGTHAAGFGQNVAHRTGRVFRRAGRFAYHVGQAAKQVKEEEAEWENMRAAEKAADKRMQK